MKLFFESLLDRTFPGLEKAMDLSWRRNEAITSNVANAETPGYRAVDLDFAGELDRAFNQQSGDQVAKTHAGHMDVSTASEAHLVQDYSGQTKPDGNNVDIDIQMGELAYNSGKYSSTARLLRKKLGLLSLAIREGGR